MSNRVAIVGGGIAGLCLAACLKEKYLIKVFDKSSYESYIVGEHVPNDILQLFEKLNIPLSLLKENSIKCLGIEGKWAKRQLKNEGIFRIGYDLVIERPDFDKCLANWLIQEGVEVLLDTPIRDIKANSIVLTSGETINFDLIIDCSGRNSNKFNNIRLVFDKLIGVTFYNNLSKEVRTTKINIESSEDGWWYFNSNKSNEIITYFTDADLYHKDEVQNIYHRTEWYKKNRKELINKPVIRACHTSILEKEPSKVFQIGDSFSSYDPLSSNGIFKAMKDAIDFSSSLNNSNTSQFYKEKRNDFMKYLKIRATFYRMGFDYYQTEFYERRVRI
jgi:flavin-dependent dehydrogenase